MVLIRQPFYNRKEWANLPENPEVWSKKLAPVYKCKKSEKNFEKRLAKPS